MLTLTQQIALQKLVCPKTKAPLFFDGSKLATRDGVHSYAVRDGIPHLLADETVRDRYLAENNGTMVAEYDSLSKPSLMSKFYKALDRDYRTESSRRGFDQAIRHRSPDELCIDIGGGPTRAHATLVNVNIAAFPNVDVVASAYALPYADGSVSAIHCEAVLEHLEFPDAAVAEMWRVLSPGGQLLAVTPFLQWFHGYPNHFQNFTLAGHERLFTRHGFAIVASGACVGPAYAVSTLFKCFIGLFVPVRIIRVPLNIVTALVCFCVQPLDRWIGCSSRAHILASTTFVHAKKAV